MSQSPAPARRPQAPGSASQHCRLPPVLLIPILTQHFAILPHPFDDQRQIGRLGEEAEAAAVLLGGADQALAHRGLGANLLAEVGDDLKPKNQHGERGGAGRVSGLLKLSVGSGIESKLFDQSERSNQKQKSVLYPVH